LAYRQDGSSLSNPVTLAQGGTNASLTAANGSLFYSTASAGALLAINAQAGAWLASNGTIPVWSTPSNSFYYYDDCTNKGLWDSRASGTGTSADTGTPDANHPGIFTLQTGTTNAGKASFNYTVANGSDNGNFFFGGGNFTWVGYINIPVLATNIDDYAYYVGMHNGWVFGTPNDGTYFQYIRSNSVNWQIVSNNNGTATTTTSSVAVTTGWHKLVMTATPSAITYFVDGVSIGTISTNLPATNAYALCGHLINKSAGTTNVIVNMDYFSFFQNMTNAR